MSAARVTEAHRAKAAEIYAACQAPQVDHHAAKRNREETIAQALAEAEAGEREACLQVFGSYCAQGKKHDGQRLFDAVKVGIRARGRP